MARRTARTFAVALGAALVLAIPLAVQAGSMQLNVKDASVQEVLKMIAEEGDFNIAIGGEVKGRVTLFVDDMAPRDLLDVVIGIVDGAYVQENGTIWVMSAAKYAGLYGQSYVDNLVSRTFVLKQAQVKDVLPGVKALLGDKAIVAPDMARNTLRIKASPRLLAEATQMLRAVDKPNLTKDYQLKSISAETAADMLGRMVTDHTTIIEDPINQRLVVNASEFELNRIDNILDMLDVGGKIESATLTVGFADPDSLADLLRPHLTPDVGTILADKRSNKIVVVDYPGVVEHVGYLASEFDVPLRQVLIEAKILQVTMSNEVRSGIDWSVLQNQVNMKGNFSILPTDGTGFHGDFGDLSSRNFQVVVEALETFGTTNLLSSPRIMVIDGGSGMIHVGSQVPYVTIDTRETATGTLNQFEKVVVVDVGVKLEVDVDIQGDDMVSLKVRPEVSSVTGYSANIPIVDAALTDSALMIEDGNTVILGGLIKDETRSTRKGIPLLASIPLLKYLFSSNVEEDYKSELVILLTPKIMTGRELYEEEAHEPD